MHFKESIGEAEYSIDSSVPAWFTGQHPLKTEDMSCTPDFVSILKLAIMKDFSPLFLHGRRGWGEWLTPHLVFHLIKIHP